MKLFNPITKAGVLLALVCVLALCSLANDDKQKEKENKPKAKPVEAIKFDAKETEEYRKLLLVASNAQLTAKNTEQAIQLFSIQLEAQRQEAQKTRAHVMAYLTDLAKEQGVAEDALPNYDFKEEEGKFVYRLRKPEKPEKASN